MELRLQPREDKYYSIEVVNDPRGSTSIEDTTVQTTNPNEPGQYREIRQVTTNTFRFSLQFAQRVGPLVGRFGIKESTGGVGLDLVLLDDRLELAQDLFGFGETVLPRWRVYLSYAFVKRLWLLGGADDILSYDRRDYFVGLNLRFNDEDLKSILPFCRPEDHENSPSGRCPRWSRCSSRRWFCFASVVVDGARAGAADDGR